MLDSCSLITFTIFTEQSYTGNASTKFAARYTTNDQSKSNTNCPDKIRRNIESGYTVEYAIVEMFFSESVPANASVGGSVVAPAISPTMAW